MGAPSSPTSWDLLLSSWIIQDGNYPDFKVGQTAEFALEFWLPDGATGRASEGKTCAANVGSGLYDVIAEVVLQTSEITILDMGVLAYRESLPLPLPQGHRLAVQLGLGVDPFFYFERLSTVADVPPLVYSWKILSILRQTAPFIEIVAKAGPLTGRNIRVRDPQRIGYEEILKTDAWKDDDGYAEYLLRCDLLPIPPKRESATAT